MSKNSFSTPAQQQSGASDNNSETSIFPDIEMPSPTELMRSVASKILRLEDVDQMVLIGKVIQQKLENEWKELSDDDKEIQPIAMQDYFYAFIYAILLEKRSFEEQEENQKENSKLDDETMKTIKKATHYLRFALATYGADDVKEQLHLFPHWPKPRSESTIDQLKEIPTIMASFADDAAHWVEAHAKSFEELFTKHDNDDKQTKNDDNDTETLEENYKNNKNKYEKEVESKVEQMLSAKRKDQKKDEKNDRQNDEKQNDDDNSDEHKENKNQNDDTKEKTEMNESDNKFMKSMANVLHIDESNLLLAQSESTSSSPVFFVYLDHENNEIIVSIRGTSSISDVVVDALHYIKSHETYGYVHAGVWRWVESLRKRLEPLLKHTLKQHTSLERVTFTGHSLGAGCAALLAMELHDELDVDVVATVFAPPCVVSKKEAHEVDDYVIAFACGDDCVPRLNAPRCVQIHRGVAMLIDRHVRDVSLSRRLLQLWAVDPRVADDMEGCANDVERSILEKFEKEADAKLEDLVPTKDLKRKFEELMAKEIENVDEEQIKTPKEANEGDVEDVDVFVSLLPPGRMFHLKRITEEKFTVDSIEKDSYLPTVMTDKMFPDHLLSSYCQAISSILKENNDNEKENT